MDFTAEFLDLMARGGPVMWVIFVVAWLAIIMLVERILRVSAWRRHAIREQSLFDEVFHKTVAPSQFWLTK